MINLLTDAQIRERFWEVRSYRLSDQKGWLVEATEKYFSSVNHDKIQSRWNEDQQKNGDSKEILMPLEKSYLKIKRKGLPSVACPTAYLVLRQRKNEGGAIDEYRFTGELWYPNSWSEEQMWSKTYHEMGHIALEHIKLDERGCLRDGLTSTSNITDRVREREATYFASLPA